MAGHHSESCCVSNPTSPLASHQGPPQCPGPSGHGGCAAPISGISESAIDSDTRQGHGAPFWVSPYPPSLLGFLSLSKERSGLGERNGRGVKVVQPDRKRAQPTPGSVMNGVRNRCGNAHHGDLAEAFRADGIEREVGRVDELDRVITDIGVYRDMVLPEIGVEESAEARIDL